MLYRFEHVFEALLVDTVRDSSADKAPVNQKRLEVLKSVYNDISDVIEGESTLKLYPRFTSGSVSIEVPVIHIEGEKVSRLKDILSRCNTFELVPLADGGLRASVTVKGVFDNN